jgi:two-component system, OmpR family, copper resistance phosphate regulon response regulator CusR
MAFSIIIVEDDDKVREGLSQALEREGYQVTSCNNGEDGFFRITTERFDLLLLDLNLPGRDGLEILTALRKVNRELPVLILSARSDVDDRVKGLKIGADDYVGKPFDIGEVLARTQAILRRGRTDTVLRLTVKDLFLDLVARKVNRAGRTIDLTIREFELLEYLMRHAGQPVSRSMLARDVWHEVNRATPIDNVIDVQIARLRRKVDLEDQDPLIHTVRGVGFCLSEHEPN